MYSAAIQPDPNTVLSSVGQSHPTISRCTQDGLLPSHTMDSGPGRGLGTEHVAWALPGLLVCYKNPPKGILVLKRCD